MKLPRTRVHKSRTSVPRPLSPLVEMLKVFIRDAGLPAPIQEMRFHDKRKWAFDLAYPDRLLAIECEGGVRRWSVASTQKIGERIIPVTKTTTGRHTKAAGYSSDCEKYNEAQLLGWRVLRFTMELINNGTAIDQVRRAYEN